MKIEIKLLMLVLGIFFYGMVLGFSLGTGRCRAAEAYLHLGVGADLNPQQYQQTRYRVWAYNGQVSAYDEHWSNRDVLKPGALADTAIGVRFFERKTFIEIHHISAIRDGFNGDGFTWISVGADIDLWNSAQ